MQPASAAGEDILQQFVGGSLSNDRMRLLEKRLTGGCGSAAESPWQGQNSAGEVVIIDSQGKDGSDVVQDSAAQASQSQEDQGFRSGKGYMDQHDSKRRRIAAQEADKLGASSKQRPPSTLDQLPRTTPVPEAAFAQPLRYPIPGQTTLPISPPHVLNLGRRAVKPSPNA